MAPPRGQFGNRLDTAAGRAKEAAMQAAASAAARGDANANAMAAAISGAPSNFISAVASTVQQNTPYTPERIQPAFVPAGGGGGGNDARLAQLESQLAQLLANQQNRQRQEREAASSFLSGVLRQYNMDSLANQVDSLVRSWGTNTEVIAEKLRQTNEYKDRFKGLLALQQRGITDVRNEGDYIRLESNYRAVFREAGIQSFLGDAGSTAERDSIADLVGKYSLSVDEVRARVTDAQRVVTESNPEVRDALQRFYNVSASDLVAYTLDPERTMGRINRIANAAMVGGYADQRGLDIDLGTAEMVGGMAGEGDINTERLSTDLTQARIVRDATKRLADIEDTDLTDSEILQSELDLSPNAQRKVRALQSRERARFGGSAAITSSALNRNRGI